jgi:nucleotide-binding universal stress UspA family protein
MAFTHVLVPTDFSEAANQALGYALEEATLHRAKVTLLHVLALHADTDVYYVTGSPEPPPQGSVDPTGGGRVSASPLSEPTVVRTDPSEEALTQLQDLIPAACRGTWDVALAVGHPADAVVRVARERNIDLIVMGTHGRTGLQHVLLGSVTEKVVRLAPCPVLTVRYKRA